MLWAQSQNVAKSLRKRENGAKDALISLLYKTPLFVGFFVLMRVAKFYMLVTDLELTITFN